MFKRILASQFWFWDRGIFAMGYVETEAYQFYVDWEPWVTLIFRMIRNGGRPHSQQLDVVLTLWMKVWVWRSRCCTTVQLGPLMVSWSSV